MCGLARICLFVVMEKTISWTERIFGVMDVIYFVTFADGWKWSVSL
jgi:hypothetical protein